MEDEIRRMAEGIGIPQEAIDNVFKGPEELESFPIGEIATFNEFINAPEGTEFVIVAIKDGDSIRTVSQCVPTNIETTEGTCRRFKNTENDDIEDVPVTWLSFSDDEGDPDIPYTDINAKMEMAGAYIGRWNYTVYHVKS